MKKLALELDTLAVQSFATGNGVRTHGTVQAHAGTAACGPTQNRLNCPETEWPSCGIVCLPTYQTGACICQ